MARALSTDFNDVRTTLQALIAIYDKANSLHTNAYDQAVNPPPTEDSVRRPLAIQLIIDREWVLAMNENPLQGSFIIDELTDLVERPCSASSTPSTNAAACSARWRPATSAAGSRTSRCSTNTASNGSLPIIGVNTSVKPDTDVSHTEVELARASEEEKASQLRRVRDDFHASLASKAEAAASATQGRCQALHPSIIETVAPIHAEALLGAVPGAPLPADLDCAKNARHQKPGPREDRGAPRSRTRQRTGDWIVKARRLWCPDLRRSPPPWSFRSGATQDGRPFQQMHHRQGCAGSAGAPGYADHPERYSHVEVGDIYSA